MWILRSSCGAEHWNGINDQHFQSRQAVLRNLWQTASVRFVCALHVVATWISYARLSLGTTHRSCSGVYNRLAHSSYGIAYLQSQIMSPIIFNA